ncbi:homeobox protein Hox-B4a-like [Aphis craccivora]|uniref:Homeobox protein Hox-B4a-like n=1 Tax=Aphis craccivora TaxID=307492 RepID=A0A6G0YMI0_APHCR|nr:homeobox protein Hox-B4a-like [Aphis craccivora]
MILLFTAIIETNTLRSYHDKRKPPNYTNEQLIQLEESYTVNPYLSQRALINLAKKLCINKNNVRLWYRKRRSRDNSGNSELTIYTAPILKIRLG